MLYQSGWWLMLINENWWLLYGWLMLNHVLWQFIMVDRCWPWIKDSHCKSSGAEKSSVLAIFVIIMVAVYLAFTSWVTAAISDTRKVACDSVQPMYTYKCCALFPRNIQSVSYSHYHTSKCEIHHVMTIAEREPFSRSKGTFMRAKPVLACENLDIPMWFGPWSRVSRVFLTPF